MTTNNTTSPDADGSATPLIPLIPLARRGHRPRLGKERRVLLASTTVDPKTKEILASWQAQTDHNLGGVLDASVAFAGAAGFPLASHKKAGAQGSTPTPTPTP